MKSTERQDDHRRTAWKPAAETTRRPAARRRPGSPAIVASYETSRDVVRGYAVQREIVRP
jgi:hypothetical protein